MGYLVVPRESYSLRCLCDLQHYGSRSRKTRIIGGLWKASSQQKGSTEMRTFMNVSVARETVPRS